MRKFLKEEEIDLIQKIYQDPKWDIKKILATARKNLEFNEFNLGHLEFDIKIDEASYLA